MTRYFVRVSEELLRARGSWLPIAGFRLVLINGQAPEDYQEPPVNVLEPVAFMPYVICTFEDDDAPPEMEGRIVDPTIIALYDNAGNRTGCMVTDRAVVG